MIRRLALGLAALAVVLALAEGAAALGERLWYGARWSAGQPRGLYASAPGTPPRLRPGARLDGLAYRISINRDGFRGPELRDPRPADAFRLWCLGGSTTFDIYAPDDASTWPAVAGRVLADTLPGRTVEVINAGVPAEVLEGNRQRLVADGPRLQPDVVVIYPGPNDLRSLFFRPGAVAPPSALPLDTFALHRLLDRLGQPVAAARATLPPGVLGAPQVERLRASLQGVIDAARALGAVPVLATHALRAPPDAEGAALREGVAEAAVLLGVDHASTLAAYAEVNRLVTELGRAQGILVVDLRAAVGPDPALWGDATHFAAPGSELAGRTVAQALLGAFVIGPPRPPRLHGG